MGKLLELVPGWVWMVLAIGLAVLSWRLDSRADAAELELERTRTTLANAEADHARERETQARRLVRIVDAFRDAESRLVAMAAATKKATDAEIRAARDAARTLRDRLLATEAALATATAGGADAEDAAAPAPGAFAPGSVGALISGPALELVGEAERAERIRIALMGCYRQYDEARDELQRLTPIN